MGSQRRRGELQGADSEGTDYAGGTAVRELKWTRSCSRLQKQDSRPLTCF